MSSLIHAYIASLQTEFATGQSTEHSFRSALKTLLESLNPTILALNESQRIVGVGMPDFTIKDKANNTINLGWIEAKDLYVDLDEKKNSDQLGRYLSAFDNFIYTNNLTFHFYRHGKKVESVSLGTCDRKTITRTTSDLFADNMVKLERLLIDFLSYQGQTITSPEKLARAMAQKAQLIKYAIQNIFTQDGEKNSLSAQFLAFQDVLVHDLTPDQFADMYAQTIAYGLFAARLYDPTLPTFSREEASRLIPKTNPLIRRLFKDILNNDDLDEGLAHIIDDLVNIFLHCDVAEILHHYGRGTKMQDPIIHFYETFLGEYDATMRKKRGVYYTPQPVVQFIVRGVDHLLQSEFGLTRGLADTSKIDHTFTEQGKQIKKSVHRVQVLDPATGTGTFLHETIRYIHDKYFAGQDGIWSGYVGADLLPRLRGFEILMASYTMAHLKIGLTLTETGWTGDDRLGIYLTNSLEEGHNHIDNMFAHHLAEESKEASKIKREQPIMIVMGNPPYAVSSSNKGERISSLIADYKKDLNERKINLDDDYIKFIRYAQYFIDKNSEGIVAMITNNSYIDGITHRQMRKVLMESFDSIYIYDLHGNSKKKETAPDGGIDQNVFDIMQGVSIIFAVKKSNSKKFATVYHYDSRGKRELKYDHLSQSSLKNIAWTTLNPVEPYYFFVPKDFSKKKRYDEGVKVDELFGNYNSGIQTKFDDFVVKESINQLQQNIFALKSKSIDELNSIYGKKDGGRSYKNAKQDLEKNKLVFKEYTYRPFDFRYIPYTGSSSGVLGRSRSIVMKHMVYDNLGLCLMKQVFQEGKFNHCYISSNMIDERTMYSNRGGTYFFPLYLYNTPSDGNGSLRPSDGAEGSRIPNLDMDIVDRICDGLGLTFGFFAKSDPSVLSDTPSDDNNPSGFATSLSKGGSSATGEAPLVKGGGGGNYSDLSNSSRGDKNNKPSFTKEEIQARGLICNGHHLPYNPNNIDKAKELRKSMTKPERKLWYDFLKNQDYRVLRQHPIDHYIVDFYIASANLVIEVDGDSHYTDEAIDYDRERTELLEIYGLTVMRFTNDEVLKNIEGVVEVINSYMESNLPSGDNNDPSALSGTSLCKGGYSSDDLSHGQHPLESIEGEISNNTPLPKGGSRGDNTLQRENTVSPEDIFDYIYAVLHSPSYRESYKEFLKIDFPRVPFTTDKAIFRSLVDLGRELRLRHLMEHPQSDTLITTYPIGGDNKVEKVSFDLSDEDGLLRASQGQAVGRVWINAIQYVDKVPQVARDFFIGGYQPAQKRLKDRKGKTLSYEDIIHYQKIIVALTHTARVMEKIDEVKVL